MVRDFERHHAWRFPLLGPAGFTEIKGLAGQAKLEAPPRVRVYS